MCCYAAAQLALFYRVFDAVCLSHCINTAINWTRKQQYTGVKSSVKALKNMYMLVESQLPQQKCTQQFGNVGTCLQSPQVNDPLYIGRRLSTGDSAILSASLFPTAHPVL